MPIDDLPPLPLIQVGPRAPEVVGALVRDAGAGIQFGDQVGDWTGPPNAPVSRPVVVGLKDL